MGGCCWCCIRNTLGPLLPSQGAAPAAAAKLPLAPGLIPAASAAASAAANVQQSLLHQQLGQQQQRGGAAAAGNLPALQQQLLQQQLQHQMQQAQQQQLLQQLQQQQHQLLQQLQQQPAVVFDNWVQCDACNKWRRAPNPITSEKWFCRMNTWAPQFASCDAPEEPDPAQQEQQQQQGQQRLLEAAAALQRQQQQLQQSAAKRQRTASVPRAAEAAKVDPRATPPTQLLRQQQLVAAAAASGQRSTTPSPQQQLQLQQQLQQAKLPQTQQQQQQHPGTSPSAGGGGQLQQLQLLQQQQLQLLQQQQVRLLDAARRATPNAGGGAPNAPAAGAAATPGTGAAAGDRRDGATDTAAAAAAERGGTWLECRSCKKWRRLPSEVDAEAIRPKFFCYLNMWDPQHNSCSSPQEPWQQLQQQQQEIQRKAATPAAAAAPAAGAALQKTQHPTATPDANRQDKADPGAAAAQQQMPRGPGQLQGEAGAAASLQQQLQEQQLLLLRMQQQQRSGAPSGVTTGSNAKPGQPAGAAAAAGGTEEDDEEGEDDIEGEGDEDEDSEDTGDSSDSESDRGGGGGPPGGAGAGGPSSGGASRGPGAGGAGPAGGPSQSPPQGHPTAGSFPPPAAPGGGAVGAGLQLGLGTHKGGSSSGTCSKNEPPASRFFDVLIVGGGIAGLAGALHCQRAGVDYQVLEARDRLGGRVWSIKLPPAASAPEQQQQRRQEKRQRARRGSKGKDKKEEDGSVWVDAGANYMHGLTGDENDVRLKPRRKGCSVYHLAAASRECRVAVVPGETGWENPYYFDWFSGGRRFCLFVVSLAHALFSRLATPVALAAGEQQGGPSVSLLKLLQHEAAAALKTEAAAEIPAATESSSVLSGCDTSCQKSRAPGILPDVATFESLALPSALRGLVAVLLRRLKGFCSPASRAARKHGRGESSNQITVRDSCACHVEGMVVRMLRSRFGFAAALDDVSATPFGLVQTPALKRDVQRLHNPRTRLLACKTPPYHQHLFCLALYSGFVYYRWFSVIPCVSAGPGLQRYAQNLSRAFTERDRKKAQAVRRFAAIPPSVSSDL